MATAPFHHHEEENIKRANRFPIGWIVIGIALLVLAYLVIQPLFRVAEHEPEIVAPPPVTAPAK